ALDAAPRRPDPGAARRPHRGGGKPRGPAGALGRTLPRAPRARVRRRARAAQRPRELRVRESLEEKGELGHRETLRVLLRAARYLGPFRVRFAGKLALLVVSLLPLLVLPWPVKIVVDHVIDRKST